MHDHCGEKVLQTHETLSRIFSRLHGAGMPMIDSSDEEEMFDYDSDGNLHHLSPKNIDTTAVRPQTSAW